tara:strand:+ start:91 stop:693 length:603 start_codon:yes stop_codon:yes gene_type:complete
MTTYSNLKYDHPFSANATGTGALTKISSQTASSSSSLSFTTGIDSTYKEYVFKFINIHPQTNNTDFTFNFSVDSGSNYNVTKTTTTFRSAHNEIDNVAELSYYAANDLAQSTSYQSFSIGGSYQGDNDSSVSGMLNLFEPSSTTFVKHFIARTNGMIANDYSVDGYVAGYGNTTSAINAVDFKMSSGNIDSGTIIMYGVS